MAYAKRLTKEELIKNGISVAIEDGHLKVYKNGVEYKFLKTPEYYVNPKIYCHKKRKVIPYYIVSVYVRDENGNKIKIYYKDNKWAYRTTYLTLQRVVWAWFYGEVPEGIIVDHINNKHDELDDYLPEKLQLLTSKQNILKDSKKNHNRQLKCSMKKPLSYYENILAELEALCENSHGLTRHDYINKCANVRAKVRYWKEHADEYNAYALYKEKENMLEQAIKGCKAIDKKRWHELIDLRERLTDISLEGLKLLIY